MTVVACCNAVPSIYRSSVAGSIPFAGSGSGRASRALGCQTSARDQALIGRYRQSRVGSVEWVAALGQLEAWEWLVPEEPQNPGDMGWRVVDLDQSATGTKRGGVMSQRLDRGCAEESGVA